MISYSGSPLAHSEGFPGESTVTSQPLRRRRPGRTLAPEISVGDVARARDEREEKKSEPLVTSVIMETLICHAPPPQPVHTLHQTVGRCVSAGYALNESPPPRDLWLSYSLPSLILARAICERDREGSSVSDAQTYFLYRQLKYFTCFFNCISLFLICVYKLVLTTTNGKMSWD